MKISARKSQVMYSFRASRPLWLNLYEYSQNLFFLSLNQPWNITLTYMYLKYRNIGLSLDVLFVNMSEGLEEMYI